MNFIHQGGHEIVAWSSIHIERPAKAQRTLGLQAWLKGKEEPQSQANTEPFSLLRMQLHSQNAVEENISSGLHMTLFSYLDLA